MRRWFNRLSTLAILSLSIHLCAVAVMKLLIPPPMFAVGAIVVGHAPILVPQPEERQPLKPPEPLDDELGEKTGEGSSIASLDLPDQMTSPIPQAFDQAWLRQQASDNAPNEQVQSSNKSSALVPSGIQNDLPAMSPAKIGKGESQREAAPDDQPIDKTASNGNAEQGDEGNDQRTTQQNQTSNSPSEPAPAGQTDADAFAKVEGVSLVGGVKARQGREVRLTRPRVDLAFRAEFTRLQKRRVGVVFRITTDETGRPRNVVTLRSSGSEQIDESVRLAMYDSWFGGKMPDEFPFEVRFYGD